MSYFEILRAVFVDILANKFRVFLTSLGIIVGAFTIVLVVGIGKGSEKSVNEQFARLNVGTIYVMNAPGTATNDVLSPKDLKLLLENSPSLSNGTIFVSGRTQINYSDNAYAGYVAGVDINFAAMSNLRLRYGDFLKEEDAEKKKKVAVIGSELANILFPEDQKDCLGKIITVGNKKYEVVGVLERMGDFALGLSIDEAALLPYEVAIKYELGTKTKARIITLAKDINHVKLAIDEINKALKEAKGKKAASYQVRDAGSSLEAAKGSARTMSILLITVAAIVLIVAGIGIMNVLFVSIKERTREIGILKAIGTRKGDILLQFLLESIIISVSGGILGIGLAIAIIPLAEYIDINVIPSLYGNVLALVFSIATGTFFGFYPALKASSLKPIDALRTE